MICLSPFFFFLTKPIGFRCQVAMWCSGDDSAKLVYCDVEITCFYFRFIDLGVAMHLKTLNWLYVSEWGRGASEVSG